MAPLPRVFHCGDHMPKLVRLYLHSVIIGFALAAVFLALLIGFDVGGMRRLLATDHAMTAIAMGMIFFGTLFSGVQFAYRIFNLRDDD